jgi:hypothetical protein
MIPPINPRAKPLGIDAEIWIDANSKVGGQWEC